MDKKNKRKSVVPFPLEKQKKGYKKRLILQAGLGGLFLLLLMLGLYFWQYLAINREVAHYHQEAKRLQAGNKSLREEIVRLQDDEYIEFLARRHLGLSRPGDETGTLNHGEEASGLTPGDDSGEGMD